MQARNTLKNLSPNQARLTTLPLGLSDCNICIIFLFDYVL